MKPAHNDLEIGLLGLQQAVSGTEVELVSSGKATLRFCIGPADVQYRVLGSSINWDRVIRKYSVAPYRRQANCAKLRRRAYAKGKARHL